MNSPDAIPSQHPTFSEADLEGVDELWHAVVRKHGRDAYNIAMLTGTSTRALMILQALAMKHHSKAGAGAVEQLTFNFNQIGAKLLQVLGISEAALAECDRDIILAWQKAHPLDVPQGSSIILPH